MTAVGRWLRWPRQHLRAWVQERMNTTRCQDTDWPTGDFSAELTSLPSTTDTKDGTAGEDGKSSMKELPSSQARSRFGSSGILPVNTDTASSPILDQL